MGAAGRKYLEGRITDERAEQLRLIQFGRHVDAERRAEAIDRLLDRYLQVGKRRAGAPSHV